MTRHSTLDPSFDTHFPSPDAVRSLQMQVRAYAAQSADTPLAPFAIERRDFGPHDVEIDILYCGVCHSDLHQARNEWGNADIFRWFPATRSSAASPTSARTSPSFKVGDLAGVGCLVDSCRDCEPCKADARAVLPEGATLTYNGRERATGAPTYGGYSEHDRRRRALRRCSIPEALDLAAAAPLLCAGITTYSPLRHWKVGAGQKVGVVGLGGLGHMGVKFAKALGADVVMFTTSPEKGEDAPPPRRRRGAGVDATRTRWPPPGARFDFLLDTVPVGHDMNPYLTLLKLDGTMVLVGALTALDPLMGVNLMGARKQYCGLRDRRDRRDPGDARLLRRRTTSSATSR